MVLVLSKIEGLVGHSRIETTGNGVHDSEFTKRVDDIEDHDTHDQETNGQRSRATSLEGSTTTNEETRTNTEIMSANYNERGASLR